MKRRRPGQFSDSEFAQERGVDKKFLEYVLDSLTSRKQEIQFEYFCRRLLEREVCPNLLPQTGPTGGGDSKVDTETYPVAEGIADTWFVGEPQKSSAERWAFAFSAKKDWKPKVRSDVEGIVSTGRAYSLIYFVTSRFVRDKDRAAIEAELKTEFKIDVRILDRSWIVEKVIEKGHSALAIQALEIHGVPSIDVERQGPKDVERSRELDELERQIAVPGRYAGTPFHLIEDCIEAAVLSRGLEKHRSEVDGKFQRALRIAKKQGTRRHQLRARYLWAWTTYWWFDDAEELSEQYDEVVKLIDSAESDDLEFASNLLTCLRSARHYGWIEESKAKLEPRWLELKERLIAAESNASRPNNALSARSLRLVQEMHLSIGNKIEIDRVLTEFIDVLEKGGALLDFSIMTTIDLIKEFEPIVEGSAVFDKLFEQAVRISQQRTGNKAAGEMILRRAFNLAQADRKYEALKQFGRAQRLFTQKESMNELVTTLVACGMIYYEKGLLWAARVRLISAIDRMLSEFWKEGDLNKNSVSCLAKMVWIEIILGRVPCALMWIELLNVLERQANLSDERLKALQEERHSQDAILGMVILKTRYEELSKITYLPKITETLGIHASEMASLYALGQLERLRSEKMIPAGQNDEDVRVFFLNWIRQPASKEIAPAPNFLVGSTVQLESKILGCHLEVECGNQSQAIIFAETILGVLEGMFASSLDVEAFPHKSTMKIRLAAVDSLAFPSFEVKTVDGETVVEVTHPEDLQKLYSSPEVRAKLRDWLLEVSLHTFLSFVSLKDPEEFAKQMVIEEDALSRALSFSELWISFRNIFGEVKKMQLDRWKPATGDGFSVLRKERWFRDVEIPVEEKSKDLEPGQGEVPPELLDAEKRRHDSFVVHSLIDSGLWDKAKWRGMMYLVHSEFPPVILLGFENIEAGREIFKGLRKKIGQRDEKGEIRISIVKGVSRQHPHHYRAVIGTDPDVMMSSGQGRIQNAVFVSRINRMEPSTSENLNRFVSSYERFGCYFLAPGKMGDLSDVHEEIQDYGILKQRIELREAWTIGENDPDMSALDLSDQPIVPKDIFDPPVLKAMEQLRKWRKGK